MKEKQVNFKEDAAKQEKNLNYKLIRNYYTKKSFTE